MDLLEFTGSTAHPHTRHPWELARVEVVKRVLRDTANLQPGDVILDVGCGDAFVAEAVALSYPSVTVYGVDIALDQQVLSALTANLKAHNLRLFKTLEEAESKIGTTKVAAVLLLDVIEHVPDDVAFLRRLRESPVVDSRSHYIISVPAFGFLFSTHDSVLGHYRRYSAGTLKSAIKEAGLEPQRVCYFFSSLLIPRLAQAAKERILRTTPRQSTQISDWRGSRARQILLKHLLIWDFSVSWRLCRGGITLPGLSNLAVCRRPA
jgi:hypothetical protein